MLLFAVLLGCSDKSSPDTADPATDLADTYTLSDEDLFPEGLDWHDGEGAFFVSSLTSGAVTRVDADGTESILYVPDSGDWMSLGVRVAPSGEVVVCAIEGFGTKEARSELWVFDPAAAERVAVIDLSVAAAPSNCNDMAFSGGMVYATDREAGQIYRAAMPDGAAEIFVADPLLDPSLIGMNGAVVTDDALLVTKYAPATLVSVPLDAPASLAEVSLSGDDPGVLPDGLDGITWHEGDLVIAANSRMLRLSSSDGWASATVQAYPQDVLHAAVTVARGRLYGLKGEVVPFALGTEVDRPFQIRALSLE